MRLFLVSIALFAGQFHTLQDRPVVHLHPHQDFIPVEFGGDTVVVASGPKIVHLPSLPPTLDSQRKPWSINVRNLGPGSITVVGKSDFTVRIDVDRTIEIKSNGTDYSYVQ